ncbi:MAG TPA: hypothetical protein VKD90_08265 [Gemmataceae bacterium]|nr:hypothetical protein [Gemmataceae bacterium]
MRAIDVGIGRVTHLAFRPGGTLLAASGHDGVGLAVWPALAEGRGPFDLARTEEKIAQVAWHPDGHLFAGAGMDSGIVWVWDSRLRVRQELLPPSGEEKPTVALAFSPDGNWLAFGGGWRDEPTRAVVVPTAKWKPYAFIGRREQPIGALVFTRPDMLVTGSADRSVGVYGILDPADDGPPIPVPSPVQALALRPDGARLAVAAGNQVHVWRVDADGQPGSAGELLCRGHKGVVRAVAFMPDGRALVSVGDDGSLRFWDPETGAARAALDLGLGVLKAVACAPDGLTVVAAGDAGTVAIVDAE